jgi:hypothetical protein
LPATNYKDIEGSFYTVILERVLPYTRKDDRRISGRGIIKNPLPFPDTLRFSQGDNGKMEIQTVIARSPSIHAEGRRGNLIYLHSHSRESGNPDINHYFSLEENDLISGVRAAFHPHSRIVVRDKLCFLPSGEREICGG